MSKAVPREVRAHPHFFIRTGQGKVKFDIGLLMLETPVDFDKYPHIRRVRFLPPSTDSEVCSGQSACLTPRTRLWIWQGLTRRV